MDASIINRFPHPVIPPLIDQPTYQNLCQMNLRLNANAASIQTTLSDVGFLALTMTRSEYSKVTKTKFIIPANPGPFPSDNLPDDQTRSIIANYNIRLAEWQAYTSTDAVLKQQVLGAVPDVYTSALKHPATGYAFASTLDILTHLFAAYGKIHPSELRLNHQAMLTPFDTSQPIEVLFEQLETAEDFALAGGVPYTPEQMITYAYDLLFQSGAFPDVCQQWQRKQRSTKTWEHLKVIFTRAYVELQQATTTPREMGYSNSHANALLSDIQANAAHQYEHINSASAKDRSDIQELRTLLHGIQQQLSTMTMGNSKSTLPRTNRKPRPVPLTNEHSRYCWTHGFACGRDHTSATCRNRAPGHVPTATAANRYNGSVFGYAPASPKNYDVTNKFEKIPNFSTVPGPDPGAVNLP